MSGIFSGRSRRDSVSGTFLEGQSMTVSGTFFGRSKYGCVRGTFLEGHCMAL